MHYSQRQQNKQLKMKKIIFSLVMLLGITYCMAQTAAINQTPAQLAEQMVAAISRDVTLTSEQQGQIASVATQYFTDLRNAEQSAPQERTALYEQFQQALKNIMTEEMYVQWQQTIDSRRNQRIKSNH